EIAPIGDAAGLADQILKVLDAPERYRRPREEIRPMFSRERTLSEYEAVYRSAAQGADELGPARAEPPVK
ncbi:MAG: hypothetical protein ABI968_11100, partial [Acidobacteriota bacterium]